MTSRRDAPRGVIGMIHLLPLPGAPRWAGSMDGVLERALGDARALVDGGVDALLIENYGDSPFHAHRVERVTIAAMTRAVCAISEAARLPVGVNVLRNDAASALAVAAASGATFIRVNVHTGGMYTDQGWIQGRAAETLRLRERIAPSVALLADVMVKHAVAPAGLDVGDAARDTWHRGLADALIVSGSATGQPTDLDRAGTIRAAVPDAPILVGSGVTAETIRPTLEAADGVIVGSAFQAGGVAGGPVEVDRVRRLIAARRGRSG